MTLNLAFEIDAVIIHVLIKFFEVIDRPLI